MKTILLGTLFSLSAVNLFAQGTVIFNNRAIGTLVTHVYACNTDNPLLSRSGNGSNDTPSGITDYAGFPLIGESGLTGQFGAATTFAQLFGATGANQPESGLQPAFPVTTFRTGAAAGQVAASTATFNSIPPDSPLATLQLRVWDNSSGLYPTWAQAEVAWLLGLIVAGKSPVWNQDKIGGMSFPATVMINSTDPSQSLKSFNIYCVPEPSTVQLVLGGGAALWFLLSRKPKKGRSNPEDTLVRNPFHFS